MGNRNGFTGFAALQVGNPHGVMGWQWAIVCRSIRLERAPRSTCFQTNAVSLRSSGLIRWGIHFMCARSVDPELNDFEHSSISRNRISWSLAVHDARATVHPLGAT
jgi:hypothetical protein